MNEEIPHERSGPDEQRVETVEDTILLLRTHIGLLAPEVEALALGLPQGEQGRCLALASVAEARRKLRAGATAGIGPAYRAEQLAGVCRALIHHWEELSATAQTHATSGQAISPGREAPPR
ncbi:DUF6415 family natural product biosynthesis protein [Streptomyces sp. 21So2-11]|uniref:DUF6415 family natural product biosynthesis protein n=1 Tax=Streptomyces sp. 21So2-11 TaxID=3144408 RepID=UPI00321936D8